MYKTILITIALHIGLSITGQDSIPRISEITYDYYSNSDNNYTMEYHYDSEDKIEYWINDIFRGIWYIEYHDWILSSTPEIPIEPHTVLSVDYYDILGRKIPKPTNGFYIERQTTDKGIISKKYFIH